MSRIVLCCDQIKYWNDQKTEIEAERLCSKLRIGILSCRRPCSLICFASGRKQVEKEDDNHPLWKTKGKTRGPTIKAINLLKTIHNVSDVREDVYGALDAWSAFEVDFPVEPVKKALRCLRDQGKWRRVIQVSKWMLSKGHGKTLSTYQLLLQALDKEDRVDEAEGLFRSLFHKHLDALPRSHFALMLNTYRRAGMYDKFLDLFADMEELGIKPDHRIVEMVADVYTRVGMIEKSEKVKKKYPLGKWEYRYVKGKRIKVNTKRLYPDVFMGQTEVVKNETSDLSDDETFTTFQTKRLGSSANGILPYEEEEEENGEEDVDITQNSDLREKVLLGEAISEELLEAGWLQNH